MPADLPCAAASRCDHPGALSSEQRRELVRQIASSLLCREREEDRVLMDRLEQLAGDPDWTVRLEVARMVHLLSDAAASRLLVLFQGDCNRYVRSHAERSRVRQRRARQASRRQHGAALSYGEQLDQLRRQHGERLAAKVQTLADQRYALLASAMVHDVRSILTTLSANAAALTREAASPARARSIQEDVGYLRRTMEAMEQFTRPLPVDRQPEDLGEMVCQAAEKAQGCVRRHGYDPSAVEVAIQTQPSVRVRVSRPLIVLALTNLIQNAIEAFASADEDKLAAGRVEVEAALAGYETRLVVRDTGPGIEPEVLRELRQFIPGGPNKAKRGSTGWGLSISHRYIAAHGGRLAIESELERGTTVTVTLPMRQGEECEL